MTPTDSIALARPAEPEGIRHQPRTWWFCALLLLGAALLSADAGLSVPRASGAREGDTLAPAGLIPMSQGLYPSGRLVDKEDLERKYGVHLLTQLQATGSLDAQGQDHDWSPLELRKLDYALANTPNTLYGAIGGRELSLFLGSLIGTPSDVAGGRCDRECAAIYQRAFEGGGLIGLNQAYYDSVGPALDQALLVHELTHRLYPRIAIHFDPALLSILGDASFLARPDLAAPDGIAKCSVTALLALRSLAQSDSDDPHVNFEEGVAETSEIYLQGQRTFLEAFGPVLDGPACGLPTSALNDQAAAAHFPRSQALYELWRDQIFAGFSYDSEGELVA